MHHIKIQSFLARKIELNGLSSSFKGVAQGLGDWLGISFRTGLFRGGGIMRPYGDCYILSWDRFPVRHGIEYSPFEQTDATENTALHLEIQWSF